MEKFYQKMSENDFKWFTNFEMQILSELTKNDKIRAPLTLHARERKIDVWFQNDFVGLYLILTFARNGIER